MKFRDLALAATLVVIVGLLAAYLDIQRFAERPTGSSAEEVFVTVHPGEGFVVTAGKLQEAGLVTAPWRFRAYARLNGYTTRIQAGEYALRGDMAPRDVLESLARGRVRLHRITVPEGVTLRQIAVLLEEAGLGTEAEFRRLAADPGVAAAEDLPADTLEGYLFPDTYHFPRDYPPREILKTMVRRFRGEITDAWRQRAAELGFTLHQVVTLASIIEKETGNPEERHLISSVFHNRLRQGMRLETDPTVIYGLADFDGNLTREHMRTPSPYNTYLIKGLPPGPIASPGRAALEAALFPADSGYLFFVSRQDGTHQFSTNWKAHQQAVRKHQLGQP